MKLLLINSWLHPKNLYALSKYENVELKTITMNELDTINIDDYDVVYNPSDPIDISKYPNTKFIFGPHFSTFPDHKINNIKTKNCIYIQPSKWTRDIWKNLEQCINLNIQILPFGVDTIRFHDTIPIQKREKVFIYYKYRNPQELEFLMDFLNKKNIDFKIFSYNNKYKEEEYLAYLQDSKYGIWVGCHESQGFALEEALSCNVPLLVWNVESMHQEYRSNYSYIPATSIPYWDERCGEYFFKKDELENKFQYFLSKLETYKPREYILENLTIENCEKKFISLFQVPIV